MHARARTEWHAAVSDGWATETIQTLGVCLSTNAWERESNALASLFSHTGWTRSLCWQATRDTGWTQSSVTLSTSNACWQRRKISVLANYTVSLAVACQAQWHYSVRHDRRSYWAPRNPLLPLSQIYVGIYAEFMSPTLLSRVV